MTCWVVIPAKPPEDAKTRLAGVLKAGERAALFHAMLHHVVDTVRAARLVDRLCILGPSRLGLSDDVPLLPDAGHGLNPALQAALPGLEATRVIVIHADLPGLTANDVNLLAAAPAGTIAIAPDRHGSGTNALSLPLPQAKDFTFAFGPDSFAAHNAEAERLGLKIETIHSHGLARDVDEPEDLPDTMNLTGKPG